jgi:hypothetical protein
MRLKLEARLLSSIKGLISHKTEDQISLRQLYMTRRVCKVEEWVLGRPARRKFPVTTSTAGQVSINPLFVMSVGAAEMPFYKRGCQEK